MGVRLGALAPLLWVIAGCSGFPVNVRTPKPLQVDVTMTVNIYQHRTEGEGEAHTSAGAAPTADTQTSDEEVRRRERMGELQTAKNSRLLGENRYGLLSVIRLPPGEYGKRVKALAAAENADRENLMKSEAAARRVPLATVEAEQAAEWRARAFPGEWIEEQQGDKSWRWVQKQASRPAPATLEAPAP
ncbi:MAG TPA: DUF1318 domain-containing protein [Candidatus Binatia bacterium]|jgi:uncharacterized protein YdbL (DUF1318 family)|nr:DUF1318 domain-containing protein [Candidatus Binatia bacterium]